MTAADRRKIKKAQTHRARMGARVCAAAVLATILSGVGGAADPIVPSAIQAALTMRILEYDRSLKSWAGTSLTVGVITRESGAAAEFREAVTGHNAQGVPVKAVEVVYRDVESLSRWVDKNGVRFLYVASDLGPDAGAIVSMAVLRRLPTLTLTRAHFGRGGTLGIVVKEGKPHILVNLASSKAVGMDLDPKLLQLAEVVR